ncbi:MBL fold metallo-hydrolase [Malikia sp.]|uniref:MBL fold metallo-hydrolase n=1 Tax=Malikia sp. TaxID=2070706 RepID=UPI00260DC648|nr:MBL fold metallo-hydrolase [Malikia sp.]MDD2730434.1 MBL fold metallo-hydrolase [Malikia sp.]
MPRPTQLLHPPHVPVPARPAATLLLLRDGEAGLEVLLTRRSASARFAPGAYVFPGGGLDEADARSHALAARRPSQDDARLTHAIAAIRESFEELGVLLARHPDGRWVNQQDMAALDRQGSFATQCAARGLTLAADQVYWLAHWITDRDLPIRFDVPFLVARMPEGQQPVADETEQFEPVWLRPQDALERHAAGQLHLIHPTIHTLGWLKQHARVDEVLALSATHEQPLWSSCPRAGWLGGRKHAVMEHEAAFGELELTCPDGQLLHSLDWQSEHPVGLLRNVQRLTAPNPGFMTGPGTNSYLVGDPATGHVAIDPGPDEPAHIERLWRAAGGDIRAIICTHSHPDHSPGAARLQALVEQSGHPRPMILGLSSGPDARHDSHFSPERELADGERLLLCHPAGEAMHTLRVLHTPGHAANHLCLLLEEDGLLFSGDHVLNGSTTVVAPPDGNMDEYLNSLDRLLATCAEWRVGFILPAHGHVLGSAPQAIERLKAHRLAREAKVAAAMRALPEGTPDDWVRLAYDDAPERLWPVAKLSLLAHVQRIESLGGFNV